MADSHVPPAIRRSLRILADAIVKHASAPITNKPRHDITWGVVDSITPGTPNTVAVKIAGDTVAYNGIACIDSYVPTVGDVVMMSHYGSDLVVFGGMSGTVAGGVQIPFGYAIMGPLPVGDLPGVHVPVPTGQSVKIVGAFGSMSSGSVTLDLKDSGTIITGLGGITVTTTPTSFPCTPHGVSANNRLHGTTSSVTGSGDMSLSFYAEIVG